MLLGVVEMGNLGWGRLVVGVPVGVVAVLLLSDCGYGGSGGSSAGTGQTGLRVTQPRTLGVGQSVVLTASSADGRPFTPVWVLVGAGMNSVGSLTGQVGDTIVYTAPGVPPIYAVASPLLPQGQVEVQVTDTTGGQQSTDAQMVITAASVTVGISPVAVSVVRGAPVYFTGYAVGAVNGAVTWQVNGVNGGSTTYGTVTPAGVYTAPGSVPVGGVARVTAVSVADGTKSATAVVTVI